MRTLNLIAVLLLSLVFMPASVVAQDSEAGPQRYISDILLVPLRTGPSIEYRIVNSGLRSGTPVILLESDPETQWSRVRAGNQEGWLPTRHLIDEPVAREQLADVQAELEALQADYSALQQQYDDLMQEQVSNDTLYQQIEAERDEALAELERVREVSGEALAINEQNEELATRNQRLENENAQLRSVNESLQGETRDWRMIIGGGLVALGLVLGLILPVIVRARRSDGWA